MAPAARPTLPNTAARIVDVLEPSSGHFVVVVRMDGLLPGVVKPFATTIEQVGIPPNEYAGRFDGFVLTGTNPDDTGSNLLYRFEKLPGNILTGEQTTSEFGGGIVRVTEQRVSPGTSANGGLKVLASSVIPDGAGASVKKEVVLPAGEDWPTLKDDEYDSTLKGFIKVEKTVVEDLAQNGSATGGSGTDRVVTEYKGLDKWRRIQVVSRIPSALIGSTQSFKKTINFTLPNEIRVEPAVVRAFATYFPSQYATADFREVYLDAITSDMGLDWQIHKGKSGPFTCDVTRTISLSSEAPETALEFEPRAERICVPINKPAIGSVSKMAGKILELTFPEALHGEWDFSVANMFSLSGLWVRDDPEDTETLLTDPGDIQDFFDNLTSGNGWRYAFTNDPISVTRAATSPSEVPKDTPFILAVNSEDWRHGLWVHDVYRYTLPSA